MDLKGLSPVESAKLELKHPVTFEVMPDAYLMVYGSDSKAYRSMIIDVARENAEKKIDLEGVYEKTTARLAKLVKEIHGLEEDGKPIIDPVRMLTDYPWIREQVDQFVMRRANFLPKA
jgi:predicted phage-related endonuclease